MYGFLLSFFLLFSFNVLSAQEAYSSGETCFGESAVEEFNAEIMQRELLLRDVEKKPLSSLVHHVNPERHLLPQHPDSLKLNIEYNQDVYSHNKTIQKPQTVGLNFTAATINNAHFLPPDSMGAIGPQQFTLAINGLIKTFNKNTGIADGMLNASLNNFFNSVRNGSDISDPRIRYDRHAQRWEVVAINVENSNNRIVIAVSDGPVISLSTVWRFFFFLGGDGCFHDYPTLGVDRFALYIGGNAFCNSGDKKIFVVNKESILGVGPIQFTMFNNLIDSNGAGLYTPQGVDNFDTNSTVGYFIGIDNAFFGRLVLRRVLNPGSTPSLSSNIFISVPSTSPPNLGES